MIDTEMAKVFLEKLLKIIQADLKDAWEALPAEEKALARAVAADAAELYASALAGADVEAELQEIRAQRANLTSAGAEIARRAFVKMAKDVAVEAGRVALAVGTTLA